MSETGIDNGGQVGYQIFGQVINGVGGIIDFDLKWGKAFGKQAAHSSIFLGVHPWLKVSE